MNIAALRTRFIHRVLADNAILAALQRNKTYQTKSIDSTLFRATFADLLILQSNTYVNVVEDSEHSDVIVQIADSLTLDFGEILADGRLRIGTAQKALNLYLKTLWAMDPNRPIPPHCPIDRSVLEIAGVDENWTQLTSIDTYLAWIEELRACAIRDGFDTLAEWELYTWSLDRNTRHS